VVDVSVEVLRWSDGCCVGKNAVEGEARLFQGSEMRWAAAQAATLAGNWNVQAVSQHGGVEDNGATVATWERLAVLRAGTMV
jgi:hypothetical protein